MERLSPESLTDPLDEAYGEHHAEILDMLDGSTKGR